MELVEGPSSLIKLADGMSSIIILSNTVLSSSENSVSGLPLVCLK